MRRAPFYTVGFAILGIGCTGDDATPGSGVRLSTETENEAGRGGPNDLIVGDAGFLDCVPGDTGPIHVEFACDAIVVYTCKDLSNIVLELEDGQHVRFMGLKGQVNTFETPDGQAITGVWVKAGNNGSGDGPGYGERVDAPEDNCDDPPGAGSGGGGSGGSGGTGGGGDVPGCPDDDPDAFCGEGGVGGGSGSGGTGGGDSGAGGDSGNGGDPQDPCTDSDPDTVCTEAGSGAGGDPQHCTENPSDPACHVD